MGPEGGEGRRGPGGPRRSRGRVACVAPVLLGLVVVVAPSLAGCSGMAQRIGTRYVTRQLDDVFDLDDGQKDRIHASVQRLIDEVPTLVEPALSELVGAMDEALRDGATDAKLRAIETRGDALADRVAARVIVELGPLFASLSNAQIDHARAWVNDELEKGREELHVGEADRLERRQDAFVEAVETWAGDVSRTQEAELRTHVLHEPDEAAQLIAVSERRLAAFEATLRSHPGASAIQVELVRLWQMRDDLRPEGASAEARRARGRATLLFVDGLMTRSQRAHAREHLAEQYARFRRFLGDGG